jgi:hypothetical protein
MKPQPLISGRVVSEKRAAAARANGAKSRGPVTALGKANSSRNNFRHGLRAQTLPVDPESAGDLAALLASYQREFQPQSAIEHRLVETMALAWWRQTCLWKLETTLLNRETSRLKDLSSDKENNDEETDEGPVTLLAFAFESLSGDGCSLDLINRLESRCDRHYNLAFDRLTAHQAHRAQLGQNINTSVRTQEVTENTPPLSVMIASARS